MSSPTPPPASRLQATAVDDVHDAVLHVDASPLHGHAVAAVAVNITEPKLRPVTVTDAGADVAVLVGSAFETAGPSNENLSYRVPATADTVMKKSSVAAATVEGLQRTTVLEVQAVLAQLLLPRVAVTDESVAPNARPATVTYFEADKAELVACSTETLGASKLKKATDVPATAATVSETAMLVWYPTP